jgi:succinate dehydrogenase / fumarate reductase cytochrome b subunit
MAETRNAARPLSPHLQVYRFMLTMMMSIVHRITGVALYMGAILLVWWLTAAATSDGYFDLVQTIFGSWFGMLVLFGFTWALVHHTLGIELQAKARIIASVAITVLLWIIGFGVMP